MNSIGKNRVLSLWKKESSQAQICLHEMSIDELMSVPLPTSHVHTSDVPKYKSRTHAENISSVPPNRRAEPKPATKQLPIFSRRSEILDAIQLNQVIVISSETGTIITDL